MKIILRILLGIVWLALTIVRPVLSIIGWMSSGVLTYLGVFLIVFGVIVLITEGKNELHSVLAFWGIGTVGMLIGPVIGSIIEAYSNLVDQIGEFVFNRPMDSNDFW